jgi:hypothetical protein
MKCVFFDLRKKSHCNTGYIDDSLLIGQLYDDCREHIRDTVALVDSLGSTIHPEKSVFIPTQEIHYLGFILNSREMTVQLTHKKDRKN